MKAIWKYQLQVEDLQTMHMPKGAKVLSVGVQHNIICVWALVDIGEMEMQPVKFKVIGTGNPPGSLVGYAFLGTVMLLGGSFVSHVFMRQ